MQNKLLQWHTEISYSFFPPFHMLFSCFPVPYGWLESVWTLDWQHSVAVSLIDPSMFAGCWAQIYSEFTLIAGATQGQDRQSFSWWFRCVTYTLTAFLGRNLMFRRFIISHLRSLESLDFQIQNLKAVFMATIMIRSTVRYGTWRSLCAHSYLVIFRDDFSAFLCYQRVYVLLHVQIWKEVDTNVNANHQNWH